MMELVEGDRAAPVLVYRREEGRPGGLLLSLALEHAGCGWGKAVLAGRHRGDVDEAVEAVGVDDAGLGDVGVGEAPQEVVVEVLVCRGLAVRGGGLQEGDEVRGGRRLDQ